MKYEFPLFYEYTKMLVEWLEEKVGIKQYGENEIDIVNMTPSSLCQIFF